MKALKAGIEPRQNIRTKARKGTFVLFGNDGHNIGMLLDISKGGLAFQYVTEPKETLALTAITVYADGSSSFSLDTLPCRTVYDQEVIPTVNNICIRRCGVQFLRLSQYQAARLKSFLVSCAMH
jgi:hypothetical protein